MGHTEKEKKNNAKLRCQLKFSICKLFPNAISIIVLRVYDNKYSISRKKKKGKKNKLLERLESFIKNDGFSSGVCV